MAKILGKNLIVKNGGSAIACARSCELNIDTDIAQISDPTSGGWTKFRAGKKSWSVTVSGLVSVGGMTSLTGLAGSAIDALQFTCHTEDGDESISGAAICKSIKLTGTIQNLAQYSAVFQGNGKLE